MLRRANEDETAAFFLVERTMRRARPRKGLLGLVRIDVPDGRVERDPIGRLRLRFNGTTVDADVENRVETRQLSDEERYHWKGLEKMVTTAKPVADSNWNLVSMRLGPRVLSRLPLGGVITHLPNGTPPFKGSFSLSRPKRKPLPTLPRPTEDELLLAIDTFLRQLEGVEDSDGPLMAPWNPGSAPNRVGNRAASMTFSRSRRGVRGRWHKCPICHTTVVKDRFNPRILATTFRPGVGAIRDLRGGYLQRLREVYLVEETKSLLEPPASPYSGEGSPGSAEGHAALGP